MLKTILLYAFVSLTVGKQISYENYKLFRVWPRNERQLKYLTELYTFSYTREYDFWKLPTTINSSVEIVVAPELKKFFLSLMATYNINVDVMIDNIQPIINLTLVKGQSSTFNFTSFPTLDEINENLYELARQYPDIVEIIVGGDTYERRQIKGVLLTFKSRNPGVFLEGGINCREWMSSAVVMYIIHQLLTSKDADIRNMAESYDWYIFPSFNPDGYVYTHVTSRLWKKTRSVIPKQSCSGIDPNKNWSYKWKTGGTTAHECSDGYPGPEPFSEIETETLSEYIHSIKDKFSVYISFNSYSSEVMYPPNDTKDMVYKTKVFTFLNKKTIGSPAKQVISKSYLYVTEMDNLSSGSSATYIKGMYHNHLVLSYGLKSKFTMDYFLQPPSEIIPTGEKTIYSLVGILKN